MPDKTNDRHPRRTAFFQAKVAFVIPGHYGRDGMYGREYDDEFVDRLMDLFEDTEFEYENICSPALLVVNTHEIPTPEWVATAVKRINAVILSINLWQNKNVEQRN